MPSHAWDSHLVGCGHWRPDGRCVRSLKTAGMRLLAPVQAGRSLDEQLSTELLPLLTGQRLASFPCPVGLRPELEPSSLQLQEPIFFKACAT